MEIMKTRIEKKMSYAINELTGLSKKCDWFINDTQIIKNTIVSPKHIFLSARYGNNAIPFFVKDILPSIISPFVLIIASEDYTFPNGTGDTRHKLYIHSQQYIEKLLTNPFLIHIFVEKLDIVHVKMTPIPLGLLSDTKLDLNCEKIIDIDFSKKPILCFCTHRLRNGEQWEDRHRVSNYCNNEWKSFVTYYNELSHADFITNIMNSKFCICVHGGGYDPCPRFFESILYGAIPIIEHSPLDAAFSKFPVIFVDKWENHVLSENILFEKLNELKHFYEDKKNRHEVLLLLTIDYWWKIINKQYDDFLDNC